jgi:hypothetical protein
MFYDFYRLRPGYRDPLVDRRTQIFIEGFPRSGNTFAVVCDGAGTLAHHHLVGDYMPVMKDPNLMGGRCL